MILFLTLVCIFGSFVLEWRRASLTGYFGSPINAPGVFKYALGNLLVLAVGTIAYWGSAFLLVMASQWPWAALALSLGFVFRGPLFRWVCGPPTLPPSESHYKVTYKKHICWRGRLPIPDSSSDFVPPPGTGTIAHDWVETRFPEPFGEFGEEVRFFSTFEGDAFERACKDSAVVLSYERVDRDAWRRVAGGE